jgi:hypothetical protein
VGVEVRATRAIIVNTSYERVDLSLQCTWCAKVLSWYADATKNVRSENVFWTDYFDNIICNKSLKIKNTHLVVIIILGS